MQRYKNGELDTSLRPKSGIAKGLLVRVEGLKHARIKFIVAGAAFKVINTELECGPMPNVMVALPNIGGALCSTPQSLADAHY